MYLVVGLGNPGRKYSGSRHNVGFIVADEVAQRLGIKTWKERFKSLIGEAHYHDEKIVILKPQTYMNRSGEALHQAKKFYKAKTQYIIVVHDEMDLPLGTIRVKAGGGSAGHRGLESIMSWLGTGDFPRVRVGIGKPAEKEEHVSYVLTTFSEAEKRVLREVTNLSSDAVLEIISNGVESAMNIYNRKDSSGETSGLNEIDH